MTTDPPEVWCLVTVAGAVRAVYQTRHDAEDSPAVRTSLGDRVVAYVPRGSEATATRDLQVERARSAYWKAQHEREKILARGASQRLEDRLHEDCHKALNTFRAIAGEDEQP